MLLFNSSPANVNSACIFASDDVFFIFFFVMWFSCHSPDGVSDAHDKRRTVAVRQKQKALQSRQVSKILYLATGHRCRHFRFPHQIQTFLFAARDGSCFDLDQGSICVAIRFTRLRSVGFTSAKRHATT